MKLQKHTHKTYDALQLSTAFIAKHKRFIKIAVLVAVSGGMIINGISQQPQILENKETIARLGESLDYEDERVEEVERLKEIVGTDEYIEKIAREKLGMVKEDEKLFVDVSKDN